MSANNKVVMNALKWSSKIVSLAVELLKIPPPIPHARDAVI